MIRSTAYWLNKIRGKKLRQALALQAALMAGWGGRILGRLRTRSNSSSFDAAKSYLRILICLYERPIMTRQRLLFLRWFISIWAYVLFDESYISRFLSMLSWSHGRKWSLLILPHELLLTDPNLPRLRYFVRRSIDSELAQRNGQAAAWAVHRG